jgi:hypothetical protein
MATFDPMTIIQTINISTTTEIHICKMPLKATNTILHPAEASPHIGTATIPEVKPRRTRYHA